MGVNGKYLQLVGTFSGNLTLPTPYDSVSISSNSNDTDGFILTAEASTGSVLAAMK
jgi:hypothetical protein